MPVVILELVADVLEGQAEVAAVIIIFCALDVGEEDKSQLSVIDNT